MMFPSASGVPFNTSSFSEFESAKFVLLLLGTAMSVAAQAEGAKRVLRRRDGV
jgi:hypothetical protein